MQFQGTVDQSLPYDLLVGTTAEPAEIPLCPYKKEAKK
jgi:hypothetical protein